MYLPLAVAALVAAAAPPDPGSQLAARTPLGRHDAGKEHDAVVTRLRAAGFAESAAWAKLKDRRDWEKYRAPRLAALRRSLGSYPTPPTDLRRV